MGYNFQNYRKIKPRFFRFVFYNRVNRLLFVNNVRVSITFLCFYEINFYNCFSQPYFPSYKIDNINMFLNCIFLWCWWNTLNSYAWYWKEGIFTPFNIVCHKIDRYMMDAVNRGQIHPQGGGFLRCWKCALTSISCKIWSPSVYRITGVIFVVSCEKLILLIRLFI